MKINEQDIQLFKTLHKSDIGKSLISYLERLQAYTCDSRNWDKEETRESSVRASKAIEEVINKIKFQGQMQKTSGTSYE